MHQPNKQRVGINDIYQLSKRKKIVKNFDCNYAMHNLTTAAKSKV